MGRFLLSGFAIIVLAVLAGGAAETSLILADRQSTSPEPKAVQTAKPAAKTTTPITTQAPAVTPAPAPVPTPPVATPTTYTATVNNYVHLRADSSTSSAIVTDLYQGDVVNYTSEDDGLWQAVTYQGQSGYVYKAYLNY